MSAKKFYKPQISVKRTSLHGEVPLGLLRLGKNDVEQSCKAIHSAISNTYHADGRSYVYNMVMLMLQCFCREANFVLRYGNINS